MLFQLRDQGTTSAEHAQKWQQAGLRASAKTVALDILQKGTNISLLRTGVQ